MRSLPQSCINGCEGTHPFVITMTDYKAATSLPQSLLKGNYVESSLAQSGDARKFIFAKDGDKSKFKSFDGSKQIAANQCWLECNIAQATELTVYFDAPTNIESAVSATLNSNIYNVAGERLRHPQKGINIVDNKKILVK